MKTKNKELEKAIKALKAHCNCADFDSKIEAILSIKEKEIVENSLVYVPKTKGMSEIKQSAYSITRSNETIVYHINGMDVVIKPQLSCYHVPFNALIDAHDTYDELNDEEKAGYEILLSNSVLIPQITTFAFQNPKYLVKYLKVTDEIIQEIIKEEPLEEDIEANAKFEETELTREMIKDIKND